MLGIGRLGKFSERHQVNKTKLKFWEFVPKIPEDTPNVGEDFYLHNSSAQIAFLKVKLKCTR